MLKLSVHSFDSSITKRNSKAQLKDPKKLAYLRDALKGDPEGHVTEGLMHGEEYYK